MVNSNLTDQAELFSLNEEILSQRPVKWCSVKLSEILSHGKRLEASAYDLECQHSIHILQNSKYGFFKMLQNDSIVKDVYHAPRFKRNYISKDVPDAVPFLGSSEMLDINPHAVKYIKESTAKSLNLFVKPETVLMSCSGTIGNVSLVNRTLENFAFSQHIMRVECSRYSGYIYTCLKNPTVQSQVQSVVYGAVIPEIEPEHLNYIILPDAPNEIKEKIHNLIIRSYKLRDESNRLIDRATELLVQELHFPEIGEFDVSLFKKNVPVDSFSVRLSDLCGRFDASYHVPIVNAITSHMRKYADEVTTIADKRISKDVILPGRFKRVYVEEGYGRIFIGGKQIHELDPSNKKYLSLARHGDRISKQLELHENMTLITCSGTIGKVSLVGKHWENWAASQHIIRIVPANKDIAGYLNVFLASEYGHCLITRFTYGAVVDEINDDHVRQISVPLLKNRDVQQQINTLALEANEKRYQAYCLEQQALHIMDQEVIYTK